VFAHVFNTFAFVATSVAGKKRQPLFHGKKTEVTEYFDS